MPKICKMCGYERQEIEGVSEYECPKCGAIYAKIKAGLKYKVYTTAPLQTKNIQIDCSACKSKASMKATELPKFNTILRIIGFIIVIPSVLGVTSAIIMFISTTGTFGSLPATQSDAALAGSAIGATIGIGFSIFIGCSSLVGGVIGWVLLIKKKVYKCFNCGFILDRA